MTPQRTLRHWIQLIVFWAVSFPYIFNDRWPFEDPSKTLITWMNFLMLFLFFAGMRSLSMVATNGRAWSQGMKPTAMMRAMEYRDSKLNGMGPKEGAELLAGTQVMDTLISRVQEDSAAGRAAQYLNGRLAGMGPNEGLEYLMGKRK